MTEYTVDSWDEMQGIKAEAGDTVTLKGAGFTYIAKPKIFDDIGVTLKIEPKFSHYQRIPKRKMTYPSQAIYKPRKK